MLRAPVAPAPNAFAPALPDVDPSALGNPPGAAVAAAAAAPRVTILHLRARARASGRLVSIGPPCVAVEAHEQIEATVVVTRTPYPRGHVTRHKATAVLDQDFAGTPNWHDDALATLCEVAEARALRAAFPELAGQLTEDEPDDEADGKPARADAA